MADGSDRIAYELGRVSLMGDQNTVKIAALEGEQEQAKAQMRHVFGELEKIKEAQVELKQTVDMMIGPEN